MTVTLRCWRLEGTGRSEAGSETLTVPKYDGVRVAPEELRQVFNDTDAEALWLIVGAPEELEDEGKIDLQKPVESYLPALKGTAWAGVRLRDIADMRSGIEGEENGRDAYRNPAHKQFQKGGWAGQLLYVNRDKDVVVAYFGTNLTANDPVEPLPSRMIAKLF